MAVQYYALDAASARSATPTTATTEDGAGTAPKVIKVVGLDVESTSAGLLAPGDVLLAIDGGAPLGDDLRAVDVQLTKALMRDGIAIITVSREGSSLDIPVPVVDLDAARTTRAATFAGCTFQDVPLAVKRKYQQTGAGAVMLTTCSGAAAAEAAAVAESRVAAARATAYAKPLGPAAALLDKNRMKSVLIDPGARLAVEQEQFLDDESALEVAVGGPKPAPSPLLATLMRTRDVQAPVTPTLITALGGARVASLDDLIAAARAVGALAAASGAPASTSVSFKGIHAGRGSFQMVDKLDLPASAAGVREVRYDRASLQWLPVVGAGATADAVQQTAAPAAMTLPSEAAEIVNAPARTAPAPAAAAATAAAAPPTPGANALSAKAIQGMLNPQSSEDDGLRMSAVDGDDEIDAAVGAVEAAAAAQAEDAAASSTDSRPAPASLLAWLALAAKARGPVPVHSSQTWSAERVAAFKRQAVTITIYDWYPLEHNTAASKVGEKSEEEGVGWRGVARPSFFSPPASPL